MKKAAEKTKVINYRKTLTLIAVAACFLMGSTAFAIGIESGWFCGVDKRYETIPTQQQVVTDVGYAPILIQSFENGFTYSVGYSVDNKLMDGDTGSVEEFKSAMFEYEKDGETVCFWQEKFENTAEPVGDVVSIVDGVKLYYSSYMNKIVPEDYQMSQADEEAQAKGELVFSWGSDSVQVMEVKSVVWSEDGIQYMLLQTGGSLSADDMRDMAKEALAHKK